ncbi:helix-turn-helix transcriptional regulator [Leucobacter ruminantium]
MVALSATGDFSRHSNSIQASWFTLAHAISTCGGAALERGNSTATGIASMGPTPIREEVAHIAALLESTPDREWRLRDLAAQVHLSPGHLSRLCVAAWGRTPRAQLAFIRVERLAYLLRETNEPVERCIHTVGWRNHGHAVSIFRRMMGMSPSEYRGLGRRQDPEIPDGSEHIGSPFQPF